MTDERQPPPAREASASARADEVWGYELKAEYLPVPAPFPDEPPALPAVKAGWSARLAERKEKVSGDWMPHVGRFLAVGIGGLATFLSTALPAVVQGWITAVLLVVTVLLAYVAVRPFAITAIGDRRYKRWRRKLLREQQAVVEQTRDWTRRRMEHDRQTGGQPEDEAWVPLKPATTQRVDVYGGDPAGAQRLLRSVAGSLLEAGGTVQVVDLAQDGVCHGLVQESIARGRPVQASLLPSDLNTVGLLDHLSSEDVAGVLSEAVHAFERDTSGGGGAGDKALDAALLEQVCRCLRGGLTFARINAAVQVVMYQVPRPVVLERDEYDALVDLLGEGARRAAEGRLVRLAGALNTLAALENKPPTVTRQPAQLTVWELSERVNDMQRDLLGNIVLQVLLHRIRQSETAAPGSRVVVVVGADRFRRQQLETLDQLARRRNIRLVLFFKHLREDAVDVLGGGDAVMFMRLGNAREAEHAATFIGKHHKLVLNQISVSESSSASTTQSRSTNESESDQESVSTGKQWARNRNYHVGVIMDFPHDSGSRNTGENRSTTKGKSTSFSTGTSDSEQTGTSTSESVSMSRVYEYAVEPTLLQSLSSTAFVLVDPRDPGSPRLGDAGVEAPLLPHPPQR
ncbi:hypothetical protein [Tenggerimyces flavus]|uniref:Uncharacterized protein n=1 Tax=Tenggerimyces flavus TaxID=1708749 RepID=A0ABV7Y402_9ACTN|nr:hypothetical protein [Tenggerimyces flavus]MBM7790628.1 hypothetical protein [Tenggerimyces flavus]